MKRNIWYFAAFVGLILGFTACEKQSAGLTSITYYAQIILEGDAYMVVPKGSVFVDPGFTANIKGEDISDKVSVSGEVDTSASGVYTLTYSAKNADGFVATAVRTVVVLDVTDAVEGIWKLNQANSFRIYDGGAPAPYKGAFELLIIKQDDGSYFVEDLMAGWYAQGAGYGADYAMMAYVSIADDGKVELLASSVPGWGDAADDLQNGLYDAATSTITYQLFYGGVIEFDVELNKLELEL